MAIGIDDTVDDPLGLSPGGKTTSDAYSAIKPIRLGEADEVGGKVASTENRLNDAAENVGFGDAVGAAFKSGDNFGYQLYKRYERESISPAPDPSFKVDDYIARNRKIIPQHLEMQFRMATSEAESNALLADVTSELRDQDMLQRRGGVSTFVAQGLAGMFDIDTLISGGAGFLFKGGALATKGTQIMRGAAAGGATQMAAAGLAFEAGTTQDWSIIPMAGLGGMAFGGLGASFGKTISPEDMANAAKYKVIQELDETVADGAVLAKRDIRNEVHTDSDPYKSRKQTELREQGEANVLAESPARSKALKDELDEINRTERNVGFAVGENDPVRKALVAATSDYNINPTVAAEHIAQAVAGGRKDIALALVERAEAVAEKAGAKTGDDAVTAAAKVASGDAKALRERFDAEVAQPANFDMQTLGLRPDSVGEGGPRVWQVSERPTDAGSIGARQLNPQGTIEDVTNRRSLEIIADAQKREQQDRQVFDYVAKDSPMARKGAAGDATARAANKLHDVLVASGLTTDFDRLMRSGSIVAQRLALDIFESASGIVRNNRSAAMLKDYFEKKLLGSFIPAYDDAYKLWAKDRGMSLYDRLTDSAARQEFNKELAFELNGRAFDPPGTVRSVNPAVKAASDAHDRWSALDIEIGKGRPNEGGIAGYDKLTAYSGYMPQKWSNDKFEKLIRSGFSQKQLTDAVSEAYRSMHPFMKKADADIWAAAVVRRTRQNGAGADTNLIGILQADGRGALEQLLRDNNMPANEVKTLIDRLTGAVAERGQAGHTKGRIDVDMRFTSSVGIQLVDMFDTDFVRTVSRRARGTAGSAALARKGISSTADRNEIIEAILAEQQARGRSVPTGTSVADKVHDALDSDKHLTRKDIEDLFSYFDAGPVAGGVGPIVSNIKKLTNLALLNQLGLTQMGEFGAQIASVGIKRWWDHAGSALRKNANDSKSELVRELKHMDVLVAEDRLFRDDLNLEMDRAGAASSELAMKAQSVLNQGQRLQGYISGFYAMRNIQQRIAVTSAADKIMTNMKGLANDLSNIRAADIGLDPKTFARIKQYVDNGTVEFKDGSLHKLNFDKWSPDDVEDFALSLNRHVNQVVQKAMAGESNILFHRDGIAAMFFHLKSFPMLALEKQSIRNVRMGDSEALSIFLYGLATSSVAYTAKQVVNGKEENLTPEKIAKGAFGYSNMTGWIPMWTDPLAGMLGMSSLKFNEYNQGIDSAILGAPAALTTLNRMTQIPGAIGNILTGDKTNNDIRALQATPIIGNAYGFNYLFNNWKEPPKKRGPKTNTSENDNEITETFDPAADFVAAN